MACAVLAIFRLVGTGDGSFDPRELDPAFAKHVMEVPGVFHLRSLARTIDFVTGFQLTPSQH